MNKRNLLLTLLLTCSSAVWAHQYDDYAQVLNTVPEYERVNTPREQCYSEYEPVARQHQERDIGGSIIGGVTGGLLGAQIGKGNGNKAATAVGAITGAIVGDRIQNQNRDDSYGMHEVRRCRVTDHWENRLTGYRVTYEYAGRRYTSVLPEDPGPRLPMHVSVEPAPRGSRGW